MDKKKSLIIFVLISIIFTSCSTKKNILYIQDYVSYESKKLDYDDIKIKKNDILSIKVNTPNPEASLIFNSILFSGQNATTESLRLQGYLVANDGTINFPIIGRIQVFNKTINQIEAHIYEILLEGGHLINHTVKVTRLNSKVTLLGEFNNPGTYNFTENSININQAIGLASDLTINGIRNNILLIREENNKRTINKIDLTKTDYLDSEFYQVKSGDIIIANQNSARIKNAGIIGNSGTLISLLSFLLSTVIIISNN